MKKFIFSFVTLSLFSFLYFGVLNNTVQAGQDDCFSGESCTDFEGDVVACTICCNQDVNTTCKGTNADDVICGDGGINVIRAGRGDDIICGFGGNDIIHAGKGCDTVFGGDGIDTASSGNDTVKGGAGCDFIDGEDGNDTLSGSSCADDIIGGLGTDSCFGSAGDDTISECELDSTVGNQTSQSSRPPCDGCTDPLLCIVDIED